MLRFCFLGLSALAFLSGYGQARRFAPDTLSTNDSFGLTLTPDGREAFWVKSFGRRDSLWLMTATRSGRGWSQPKRASFSDVGKNIDPFATPDGKLLLFNSDRPRPERPGATDFDIWASPKTASGWGTPFRLPDVNSDSADFYATAARNGNLYFTSSRAGGLGGLDLYVARHRAGRYDPPQNLGPVVNSTGAESNPFIDPDERFLLFFSVRPGGYGDSDLYVSFREAEGWQAPQNLGPLVNGALGEFCPFVSADGKTLYFSRIQKPMPFVENIYQLPTNQLPFEFFRKRK